VNFFITINFVGMKTCLSGNEVPGSCMWLAQCGYNSFN